MNDFASLPPDLPVPEDDGAADHLPGAELPRRAELVLHLSADTPENRGV